MYNKISYILVAALFASGCSTKPVVTPSLQNAQKAYRVLKADSQASEEVPLAVFQAGKIYDLSKNAQSKEEADHMAYLLEREVEVANESAKEQHLQKQIQELKTAYQEALLNQKETELLVVQKEMLKAKQQLQELKELNAQQTNRGLVLTLGDVLFETGKASLLAGSQRAIDKLVEFLRDNPQRQVLIEGHTDNVGSVTYNIDLSLRRAQAVGDALIARGIASDRIVTKGYGETYPVAPNNDAAGRQRNRRVEIVILEEGVNPEEMMR